MVASLKLKEAEDTGQYSLPLSDFVSIFHHPRVVEAEVTEQDSLLLTRDFIATAMFDRGLFDLNDEYMKLIKPMDAESHRLIEKGFYIGLLRKYFIFCTCETVDEEYTFSSRDSYSNSQDVMLNISLTGNKNHGETFKSTADVTLNQLRSSSFKMLSELMSTLDKMPDEPQDYKPPFFSGCLENEAQYLLAKNTLRVEVGNVNSKRLVLTLKISRSQGNYLELTDVFSNFPHLSLTRDFIATAMFNRGLFDLNDEYMKLIRPMDAESHRLIEKGFYTGLLRKYFIFCTCETVDEKYTFSSRDHPYSNSQAVMLNISLTGNKSHGGTFISTADVTLNQLRSFKMLGDLMSTLDKMPDEPQDYRPPFFSGCLENEAQYLLAKNPLRVEVGNVNSKRLVLTLKISRSQGNYLVLTDVFSNFPHLSLAISEDIMDQLETEVVISETGKDTYVKNRDKGKSVLEPCEKENEFMRDDGKRTRSVTKNARCKFFAEGFCPFGDECWFSHHVGGDGNSCRVFSCEASGSDNKGKSVLKPCENDNDFIQGDGKCTRPVRKNARCKFFAEGFCPFGDECWFSHHVGGDGNSCCVFSCEASGSDNKGKSVLGRCCWDTSVSKVFRKPELRLAGVQSRNMNILETAKESVSAFPDHALTPSDLNKIFGPKLYDVCCKKEEPPAISCWFEKFQKKGDNTIYENQLLCWRSPKRSPGWRAGVTRVDRKWVQLSEEDKKKDGPIRSEQEDKMVGDVRDQGDHELCSAFVCVNLVSSRRVIEGLDKVFVNLSVKELCFYASPHDRLLQTSQKHKCHPMLLTTCLKYIRDNGVTVQQGAQEDSFNCVTDKPKERNARKIHIADCVYLGNDLQRALKTLEKHPIGATLVIFSDYWSIKKGEIYRGPKSDHSRYEALHGVTIVDAFLIDGELVFWCKSSHGPKTHDKGYILVSGEMMVMGHHFTRSGDSAFGVNRGVGGDTALALSGPKGLIHEFVYPELGPESSAKKRKI